MTRIYFRSSPVVVLVLKYWGTFACISLAMGILTAGRSTWRPLLATLPILLAAFLGSLVIIEVRDGRVCYRRLSKWVEIQPHELIGAKIVLPPFIGCIKLRRFALPWGRLYFILDKNAWSNPFSKGNFTLVNYLNKRELHEGSVTCSRSGVAGLNLSVGVGILTSLMILYLIPRNVIQSGLPQPTANTPSLLKALMQFVVLLRMPAVQVAGAIFMLFLAVRKRHGTEAWLYAFLFGFGLALVAVRLLL